MLGLQVNFYKMQTYSAINKKTMTERQQESSKLEIFSFQWVEQGAEDTGESQDSSLNEYL